MWDSNYSSTGGRPPRSGFTNSRRARRNYSDSYGRPRKYMKKIRDMELRDVFAWRLRKGNVFKFIGFDTCYVVVGLADSGAIRYKKSGYNFGSPTVYELADTTKKVYLC